MAYFAPFIDETGLHIPTYQDILEYLTTNAKTIFGQDIYLDSDSADYQILSIFALIANDSMQSLQLEYNSRSPLTAIGAALDSLVKLNGIRRKPFGYSTVVLNLTGKANYTIQNCIAKDINGVKWNLPEVVLFDNDGNAVVTAISQTAGTISAAPGSITAIDTPTLGWYSVTNANAASVGLPVESDSKLRARQAISTELSSETLLDGTKGAIANIDNVNRYEVYENDTNVEDVNTVPAHSISAVVEGGSDFEIASAIYSNKGPGCGTFGTTTVIVNDPLNSYSNSVKFFRPTYTEIYVTVNVHNLYGWNDTMLDKIQAAIISYLNNLKIGQTVTPLTGLTNAVLSAMPDINNPAFSIQLLTAGLSALVQGTTDIAIDFNAIAQTDVAKVIVSKV